MKKLFLTLSLLGFAMMSFPTETSAHPGHEETTLVAQHTPPHRDPNHKPPHHQSSQEITTTSTTTATNKYARSMGERLDEITSNYNREKIQNFFTNILVQLSQIKERYKDNQGALHVIEGLEIALKERINTPNITTNNGSSTTSTSSSMNGDYMDEYIINDATYGTEVTVTLDSNYRYMSANGLPNHPTGDFPNRNNPNSISEQSYNFTVPLNPTKGSKAQWQQVIGVAINGVFIEPETAERVTCSNGDTFKIEAFQDFADLGFDVSNAHVQPNGSYHYHGIPEELIDTFDTNEDFVHVGFAADGFPIYYSRSDRYSASYRVKSGTRGYGSNVSCIYQAKTTQSADANVYDGKLVEDWEYVSGLGDLDECNGITVDGQYMYMITEEYPYVGRCLYGDANGSFGKR